MFVLERPTYVEGVKAHTDHMTDHMTHSLSVAAQLHGPQLLPRPGVQLGGADKREVHAEGAVHSGAVDTQEHAIRD